MRKITNGFMLGMLLVALMFLSPAEAYGMHIMEGFLTLPWALFWWVLSLPFLVYSIYAINKVVKQDPGVKMLLGVAGAFTFIMSALKLPSVNGSSSHPTGMGLGTVMFGPGVMPLIGAIVLLFQATLLAHGGLTTLGANIFSMAIVGPFVGYGVYRALQKAAISKNISVFCAAFLADLVTYIVTSIQLALAFPDPTGGIVASLVKFLGIFAVTQIPLAIGEGILTVIVLNFLLTYDRENVEKLQLLRGVN